MIFIHHHPSFQQWLEAVFAVSEDPSAGWDDVAGEIMVLIAALEEHGRSLDDPVCRQISDSRFDLYELRRTSWSWATPFAVEPPVLRILFGYVRPPIGDGEDAVVLLGGDKTNDGNQWYRRNIPRAEDRLLRWCAHQQPPFAPVWKEGAR